MQAVHSPHHNPPPIADVGTTTRWKNPLSQRQHVDLHVDGRLRRFVWEPGEEKDIPSQFDSAIHVVHAGVILGGLAPQLVRVSPSASPTRLHEALDQPLHEQREREAFAAAAVLQENVASAIHAKLEKTARK